MEGLGTVTRGWNNPVSNPDDLNKGKIMSCKEQNPIRILAIVTIDYPAEPNPYPDQVPLDANNRFASHGRIAEPYAVITAVSGRVNDGTAIPGTFDNSNGSWRIENVGPAIPDQENTLVVRLEYRVDGQNLTAESGNRRFFALSSGGGGSGQQPQPPMPIPCPQPVTTSSDADSLKAALKTPRKIIQELLPRYLSVRFATGLERLASTTGGLLARSSVQLAYAEQLSSPFEAVWTSVNLPESIGFWRLRMESREAGAVALLVFSRFGDGIVMAPAVYQCIHWNWRATAVFVPYSETGTPSIATEFSQLPLLVEPA